MKTSPRDMQKSKTVRHTMMGGESISNSVREKINLFLLGKGFKAKYYLLKYSLAYHLRRIGVDLTWSKVKVKFPICYRNNIYEVHVLDDIFSLGVFREIFGEMQYDVSGINGPVQTIFDLGAHIGIASLYFHAHFPHAQFVCVEPEEKNLELLKANLLINGINARISPKAINSDPLVKLVRLHTSESSTAHSTLEIKSSDGIMDTAVAATTLDELCTGFKIERVDLLKCDIEGAEGEIFEMLGGELKKRIGLIFIEYHSSEIRQRIMDALYPDFEILEDNVRIRAEDCGILLLKNRSLVEIEECRKKGNFVANRRKMLW